MAVDLTVTVNDQATPFLAEVQRALTDLTEVNQAMAASVEDGTAEHVRKAASTRHETASKLGARPTGYLTRRADLTEGRATAQGVTVSVTGAIFRRAFGPVTVKGRERKFLTIPWRAEAYGRRAGEFGDKAFFVYRSKRGQAFLAKRSESGRIELYYLLKRSVVLPQDRGLLPSEEAFGGMMETGAREWFGGLE